MSQKELKNGIRYFFVLSEDILCSQIKYRRLCDSVKIKTVVNLKSLHQKLVEVEDHWNLIKFFFCGISQDEIWYLWSRSHVETREGKKIEKKHFVCAGKKNFATEAVVFCRTKIKRLLWDLSLFLKTKIKFLCHKRQVFDPYLKKMGVFRAIFRHLKMCCSYWDVVGQSTAA